MKNIFLIMLSITFYLISCEKEDLTNKTNNNDTNEDTTNGISAKNSTNDVIPSVEGQFYSYSANFSVDRPLYYMMSCKANKDQPISEFSNEELNLSLIFDSQVSLNSADNPNTIDLLGNELEEGTNLNNAEIRNANISVEEFYYCFNNMNESLLLDIINNSSDVSASKVLNNEQVLAITTSNGKFGLILVKDVSENSVQIDACHVLK